MWREIILGATPTFLTPHLIFDYLVWRKGLVVALGIFVRRQGYLSRHKQKRILPKELENHPKIHNSSTLGDIKIRRGVAWREKGVALKVGEKAASHLPLCAPLREISVLRREVE